MRKLLLAAVLGLAGVGLTTEKASAWIFPCLFHSWRCRDCATLCIKPYNAFSPIAYGSICADGCFPIAMRPPGMCGFPPPPPCIEDGCMMNGAGCGLFGPCAPPPGEPVASPPPAGAPASTAEPSKFPAAPPPASGASISRGLSYPVQAAAYYPGGYYPTNPYAYAPRMPAAPWTGYPGYTAYPGYYGYAAYPGYPGMAGYPYPGWGAVGPYGR
jgi:hypothetical protein